MSTEQISPVELTGSAEVGKARGVSTARFCWNAAVIAVLAVVILSAEAAALGLALVWSIVHLLHLPDVLISGFGVAVIIGSAMAGVWLYRTAYGSEIANRSEFSEVKRTKALCSKENDDD